MDKKKSIELIKLEVLGCLTEKDKESIQAMKISSEDFPWKELAEYQKIVSLLPSILEIKYPANDLKDKTAMKLYNIRDEIKAKIDVKKAQEVVLQPVEAMPEPEKPEPELKYEFEENIEIEEKMLVEVEKGIQISEVENSTIREEPFKIFSNYKGKSEPDNFLQTNRANEDVVVPKQAPDKESIEKVVRDYINAHLKGELELFKGNIRKNRIISFILFVITMILIGVIFIIK